MIRTNIVLDEKLVKSALKVTKIKTRRALIDYALRELLRHAKQNEILKLRGKIHWEGDLQTSREGRNS
jgi:Arc/MetJ family transcription regulator